MTTGSDALTLPGPWLTQRAQYATRELGDCVEQNQRWNGTSNVLQVVESCDLRVSWTEPRDLTFRDVLRGINPDQHPSFSSRHPGGALAAPVDGEVQFLSRKVDLKVLRRLATTGSGIWPGAPCDAPLEYADDVPLTLRPARGAGSTPGAA